MFNSVKNLGLQSRLQLSTTQPIYGQKFSTLQSEQVSSGREGPAWEDALEGPQPEAGTCAGKWNALESSLARHSPAIPVHGGSSQRARELSSGAEAFTDNNLKMGTAAGRILR